MKPAKYLIDNEDIDIFFYNGKYWFFKDSEGECAIVPAVGDVVEYENKERTMVVCSSVEDQGEGLSLVVDMLKNRTSLVLNKRGRQRRIVEVMDDNAAWPMENIVLIRDGVQLLPITLKYRIINKYVLNKLFIKKYIHSKYIQFNMNCKEIMNKFILFKSWLSNKFYEYKNFITQKFKVK